MTHEEHILMLESALANASLVAEQYRRRSFMLMRRCRELRQKANVMERDCMYWFDKAQQGEKGVV